MKSMPLHFKVAKRIDYPETGCFKIHQNSGDESFLADIVDKKTRDGFNHVRKLTNDLEPLERKLGLI